MLNYLNCRLHYGVWRCAICGFSFRGSMFFGQERPPERTGRLFEIPPDHIQVTTMPNYQTKYFINEIPTII